MSFSRILISRVRSLQWRLVFIFIAMTICLIIPIFLFLKYGIESSYYDALKKVNEDGALKWNINENSSMDDIWNDLDKNKTNGKKYAIYYFNLTSENKTYSIINTKRLNDINNLSSSSESIKSVDPEYQKDSNGKQAFIKELFKSENFISAIPSKNKGDQKGDQRKLNYTSQDSTSKDSTSKDSTRAYFDYAFSKGEYVIYFRYYSDDWKGTIDTINNTIITSGIVAVIFSLTFGFLLSKTITRPIINIMHGAQDMAKGNFNQVLQVKSDDEIGKLTKSFNYMANELKSTLNEISSEKNKIETILNYMTDGIIAFNLEGEVIHSNPAARDILEVSEFNDTFNDFSTKYELGITLEDVIYFDTLGNKEKCISINDKFIRVYFALFTDEGNNVEGIIVVFHDITEQQKLENMRREFVANVSHELRTPLTSIKSYTETILDGVLDDRETSERFLGVINSEADRMTRLVKDLLQLSSLENQQMKWNVQDISFVDLVKNVVGNLQIEAKNKEQSLESFVIGEIPQIKADHDRIEQVVINILSNAIKYTPKGGKITVYVGKLFNEVYVKVIDTGIGIPQKDLPRIFERFYRVDKARSREMGGTGLGLSIAKEIIEAQGGTITINSEPDKGTEVIVKLPIEKPFKL